MPSRKRAYSPLVVVMVFSSLSGCTATAREQSEAGDRSLPFDAAVADVNQPPQPPSCGGTTDVTGTTPSGTFVAGYVYVDRCQGDCVSLGITIATNQSGALRGLRIGIWSDRTTGSFVGVWSTTIAVEEPGVAFLTVPASVEITASEPSDLTMMDGGFGPTIFGLVSGALTVHTAGVDLTGSFSSPVCFNRLSV